MGYDDGRVVALSLKAGTPAMPDRFDDIERKIESLSATVDLRFDAVDQKFDAVDQRFDAVDQKFDAVDQRLAGLSRKVDVLHEATRGEIRLLAELIGATNERMDRGFAELRVDLRESTAFLQTVVQGQNNAIGELKQ